MISSCWSIIYLCALIFSPTICETLKQRRVVVTGATGKLGRLVVQELLSRRIGLLNESVAISVSAAVRDLDKAQSIFAKELASESDRLNIVKCDLTSAMDISNICENADAVIWCATGFKGAENLSIWDKFIGLFSSKSTKDVPIDIASLALIGESLSKKSNNLCENGPQIVMCSSAGVTRPTWSEEKKQKLVGAADIPIIRLNPLDILGTKRESEDVIRKSGVKYSIVRPCGLNDNWPSGRPLLSQGDVAVGRICRSDVASLLVDILLDSQATMKTFEVLSIPGYPKPRSYLVFLLMAQYAILQQLVPGEILAPNQLAMGQTYEQLDKGEEGRLGKRKGD
eukprot:gene12447-26190_t